MEALKRILQIHLERANRAIGSTQKGVGITFYNEDARIEARVLTNILNIISKLESKEK